MSYEEGKIYKLVSKNTNQIYIGSTINSLSSRLSQHVHHYRLYKLGKYNYLTSFIILDAGDYSVELIEKYPCSGIKELNVREGQIMLENPDICVNKKISGRTVHESYKACYKKHQAKYLEYQKQYYRSHSNVYYKNNKEIILKKRQEYYKKNREAILAKYHMKVDIQKETDEPPKMEAE